MKDQILRKISFAIASFLVILAVACSDDSPTDPSFRSVAGWEYTAIGLDAQYHNRSTGASNYSWTFGDLSPASNEFEPFHQYVEAGTYLVRLRACPDEDFTSDMCDTAEGLVRLEEEE